MKVCDICGSNKYVSRNKTTNKLLCSKHLHHIQRHGQILEITRFTPNEIILYNDRAEIVLLNKKCEEVARTTIDLDDVERLKKYKWYLSNYGYAMTHNKEGKNRFMHNIILRRNGNVPNDCDHINRIKLDNRKINFRIVTKSMNSFNAITGHKSVSGVPGVHFDNKTKSWRARGFYKGKMTDLGRYKIFEEAVKVRLKWEHSIRGEYKNKKNKGDA